MKKTATYLSALLTIISLTSCTHIEATVEVSGGGTLEDALLIASANGAPPREVYILGDIDLSDTLHTISQVVPTTLTHWWIIGSFSGNTAYTSNVSLTGVDMYTVEPYDISGANLWNIPSNLDGYVNGTTYSLDWWAQTINNYSSHVALDQNSASLYEFSPNGSNLGTITVDLRKPN